MSDSQSHHIHPENTHGPESPRLDTWNDGTGANPYDPPTSSVVESRKGYWRYGVLAGIVMILFVASFFMIATSSTESIVVPDVQVYDSMSAD